ncbi:MAG TPA: hypothetical protein PKE26_02095 [Kiritimatiellia bacterium]|nr:hypothetical protein [Kiritimatiellia bacterium]HMO97880.1 hypothetical protein [Kiritimatiellia bacterium]HMP95600.1 hypothetical protein [Kiritimatiellia bacterium]
MSDKKSNSHLSLSTVEIPEARYRADMDLHDRFQTFSGELLKIALGGLAVIGFFIALYVDRENSPSMVGCIETYLFWASLLFAAAGAFCMIHRFLASNGMFHHILVIKLLIVDPHPDDSNIIAEETTRNLKFKLSEMALKISAILIIGAGFLLALTFKEILSSIK